MKNNPQLKFFVSLKLSIQKMKDVKIEFRKPMYPVNPELMDYLEKNHRLTNIRFYYDDLGFKALETKFVRGYSMIFIVPIVIAILVYVLQKVL